MPTPAEIEARFARFEGLGAPTQPRRNKVKERATSTTTNASSIAEDELEENRKQLEREAKKRAEREAEREARWTPSAAPVPEQLQAGDRARTATLQGNSLVAEPNRERSTTLERSVIHDTASAISNSKRPAPQIFAAPTSPAPTTPLPQFPFLISSPAAKATKNEDFLWSKTGRGDGKSVPPLEQPRRAPQPPRRPLQVPGEDFRASPVEIPLRRGLSDTLRADNISALAPSVPLPQIPLQKPVSPLDPHLITGQRFTSSTIPKSPPTSPPLLFSGAPVSQLDNNTSPVPPRSQVMAIRGRQSSSETSSSLPYPMVRSSTAPPTFNRKASSASRSTASSSSTSRRSGRSRFGRKDAGQGRRSLDAHPAAANRSLKTSASIRSALSVIDDLGILKSSTTKPTTPGGSASRSPGIFKRTRKGETMSMLLDTGFFPVEELIYGKDAEGKEAGTVSKLRQSQMYRVNLPPRLSFLGQQSPGLNGLRSPTGSPDSPTDSMASPMSPTFSRRSRGARNRRSGMVRSPLTQISENKVVNTLEEEEEENHGGDGPSPTSTLAAIVEGPDDEENIPPEIGSAMPATREIRLRGGSVVTVTPPEMTAWRCSIYLHGTIKLPKPAIMPRKNSVASLEPFQDMVDDMYQHSLVVPRRRSDDAVVDDICDFFDDFGFDVNIVYDGDRLEVPDISMDEAPELEIERFSTPPLEPSPLEIGIAKEVMYSYPMVVPARSPPPVETEETLRARGKARLSRGSMGSTSSSDGAAKRESLTLGRKAERSDSVILPLPQPDGSMIDPAQSLSLPLRSNRGSMFINPGESSSSGRSGVTTTDSSSGIDVQEISGSSSWVTPEVVSKVPSASTRKTRNPLSRFMKKAGAS